MERWKGAGLGPLESAVNPADEVPHWLKLDRLAGRGTVADTTAIRLAQPPGFACRRYGVVLRRTWGLNEGYANTDYDPYGADEASTYDLAQELGEELDKPDPPPLDLLFRDMLASVRRAPGIDGNRLAAALSDIAVFSLGGLPTEESIPATGNTWRHIRSNVSPWLLSPGPSPIRQVASMIEHDLPEAVAAVPMTIDILRPYASNFSDETLADLATLLAPMQVLFARRIRAAFHAWSMTGSAWQVDFGASTPQFAMIAEGLSRPDLSASSSPPPNAGTLVVEIGGAPGGPREERLVLRRM